MPKIIVLLFISIKVIVENVVTCFLGHGVYFSCAFVKFIFASL